MTNFVVVLHFPCSGKIVKVRIETSQQESHNFCRVDRNCHVQSFDVFGWKNKSFSRRGIFFSSSFVFSSFTRSSSSIPSFYPAAKPRRLDVFSLSCRRLITKYRASNNTSTFLLTLESSWLDSTGQRKRFVVVAKEPISACGLHQHRSFFIDQQKSLTRMSTWKNLVCLVVCSLCHSVFNHVIWRFDIEIWTMRFHFDGFTVKAKYYREMR